MAISVGEQIPDIKIMIFGDEGPTHVQTSELLGHGKVVLFAVPGAFTPTCSDFHLPGYVLRSEELTAKGVDSVVCLSVNDPFVMGAWGKSQNGSGFGLGARSQRYAMVLEDGVVTLLNVEPGSGLSVSGVEEVLAAL